MTLDDELARGRRMERVAWLLALAGFIPFAALALLLATDLGDAGSVVNSALKGYAVAILSFLGGIRWGVGLTRQDRDGTTDLALSVLPSLLGWIALLLPAPICFAVFGVGFAAMGAWDSVAGAARPWPEWFSKLRITLTLLVTATMIVAFLVTG